MARETLKLQGIQRNRKQRKFDPGSANELINIRPRDGVWEVIGDKKVFDTIEAYTPTRILAYHAMKDAQNIIFIAGNLIVSKSKGGGYCELMTLTSESVAAETINNILVLSLEDSFSYFVWKNGEYIQISTLFEDFYVRRMGWEPEPLPLPPGVIRLVRIVPTVEVDWTTSPGALLVDRQLGELPKPDGFQTYPIATVASVETEPYSVMTEQDRALGDGLEAIQKSHAKGFPVGPVNIVFTIELYDGTEIAHTAPVRATLAQLFAYTQPGITDPSMYFAVNTDSHSNEFIWLRVHGIPLTESLSGIIKGICVYISRPYGFAGEGEIGDTVSARDVRGIGPFVHSGQYCYDEPGNDYESIFRANLGRPQEPKLTFGRGTLPEGSPDAYVISSSSGFHYDEPLYRVAKIGYADIQKDAPIAVAFADISNDKIVTYPPLPPDNFSHHKLTGSTPQVYNGRLFTSNIKTTLALPKHPVLHGSLSRRHTTRTVREIAGTSIGYGDIVIQMESSSYPNTLPPAVKVLGYWNGSYYSPVPPSHEAATHQMVLQVILATDNEESSVTSPKFTFKGSSGVSISGMYSYPDSRAKTLRVYSKTQDPADPFPPLQFTIREFPMVASEIHNLSYASISLETDGTIVGRTTTPPGPSHAVLNDTNRVQASALNNPFVFPAINSYRVGSSEVVGLQTINNAISEGQFGEYPMIAFTKSGVWAMSIAEGERLISNIVPLANEICTNPASITAVRKGIAFVTAEGLKIISGGNAVNISEIVRGNPGTKLKDGAVMQKILDSSGYSHLVADVDFDQYIQGAKIGYDDYHEELIISNPAKHYSYLFNLETNAWYCASVRFDGFLAKFPYLFGFDGPIIYSTNKESRGQKNVLYISNEINFANVYSKFEQMLARGQFGRCRAMVFGTTDLENWKLLSIATTPGGFDMRLPRGFYTCKSFVIVLDGTFEPDSYLEDFDVETKHRYGRRFR